ncbi:NADH:flavin oxidoreductase [Vreelandella boliviensis]|uniref:12-oxophytodienoate reductase n=1 Tax=Vreelandella boliviensis LC1 TaxID=1072583 RepID=A0A265DWT8_9GAMM|nr:NADH:flavin oxidoreductase [Halomonas boliviensis]EHJ93177.1 NADH oxidase [Halomonas boliviensis LC1]OZT73787.1 12-oxophytodienoate reductase [Halomonas boliviensis LC1]
MSTPEQTLAAPLFESFAMGPVTLPNRIVMAPMTRNQSPNGVPGDNVAAYYRSRAEGGVGLIITEGTYIDHPGANGYPDVPAFHGEQALAGWQRVVEGVHAAGGKIVPQLWHVGRERRPGVEPDTRVPGFGPMAISEDGVEIVRAMNEQDMLDVAASFARAASDAQRLGFDGIELHGAHGYLIDQFLWSESNQRTDAYGGSPENRLRFPRMIVRAVREAVGPEFPIIFRFSQWKLSDYTAIIAETPEALGELLKPLADDGVDIFHASTRRVWEPGFAGSEKTLATLTRELTGKPVIAVGSVGLDKTFRTGHFTRTEDPTSKSRVNVEELAMWRSRNDFDLIAIGRALLSDPQWANKVRDGRLQELSDFDSSALEALVS